MTSVREPGDPGFDPVLETHAGKYYGVYHGIVKDVNDPDKAGRIRIFIPALFTGPDTAETQWTSWAEPMTGFSKSEDGGRLDVPPVGSSVSVLFKQGHTDFPRYTGGSFFTRKIKPPKLSRGEDDGTGASNQTIAGTTFPAAPVDTAQYPHNHVWKLESGWVLELDDTPNAQRFRIRHPSGAFFEMQPDGTIAMRSPQGVYFSAPAAALGASNVLSLVAGLQVLLGAGTASDALVKGTTFSPPFSAVLAGIQAFATATKASTVDPVLAPAATALETVMLANVPLLTAANILSTKVFTE